MEFEGDYPEYDPDEKVVNARTRSIRHSQICCYVLPETCTLKKLKNVISYY